MEGHVELERFGRRMIELLPQLARGFARHEHNYLSRGEITLPQLWALEYLSREGSSPMNAIAQFLNISRPAATGLVDRLISQGLVRRVGDTQDRRIIRVSITAKGQRISTSIWEQKRRMILEVFGQISPDDRAQYLATLERVATILSAQQPGHRTLARVPPRKLAERIG